VLRLGHPDAAADQELVVELVADSSASESDGLADEDVDPAELQRDVADRLEILDAQLGEHGATGSGRSP